MHFINQIAEKAGHGKHHNSGIHCDVTNCIYHDPQSKCAADKINVGPTYAASSTDTACATFKQKM